MMSSMALQTVLRYTMALFTMLLCSIGTAQAQEKFLAEAQAFSFEARSVSDTQVELTWKVAPEYYLYKHQFAVKTGQQAVAFELPPAKAKHDDYFGDTEVYYQNIGFKINVQPNQNYQVNYQGCAEKGLCYPPSNTHFKTDADGLVILADSAVKSTNSSLWNNSSSTSGFNTSSSNTNLKPNSDIASANPSTSVVIAQDQQWSDKLHERSLLWSVVVFLGLGCLLAFTPCSLPMLPILSSLLVRKHEGVKAIFISLTFVFSMASVYALLGVLAASAGSNFQRWLQQPFVLMSFSALFIIFALNLFGVFELKLPQTWANRLDRLQANQQGGTLLGAGVMGMLSALLVGPCMTAPLAGTLLYISQTQNIFAGAGLLFSLGLGMGIPLILLTLIGQKALPKPGLWMNYVRHIFAFLMLGLSLYFVRPLLPEQVLNLGLLTIVLALIIYLGWLIKREQKKIRYAAMVLMIAIAGLSIWQSVSYWQYSQNTRAQVWMIVRTEVELDAALQQAKAHQQAVVVDLYADWCVACQPLEREVWAHPQVQITTDSMMKIKLDLSQYEASQQNILNTYELLGPPTALFMTADGAEQRNLRLTGSFTREQLLEQLKAIQQN